MNLKTCISFIGVLSCSVSSDPFGEAATILFDKGETHVASATWRKPRKSTLFLLNFYKDFYQSCMKLLLGLYVIETIAGN